MYVKAAPGYGPTQDTGLGLDFDFGSFINNVAPAALQLYGNKQQLDAAKIQANALKAQQAAQMQAMYTPQQQAQPYYGSAPTRGSVGGDTPKWLIPAAIGGAGLVLALMLRR
jgi:hypothetical protein